MKPPKGKGPFGSEIIEGTITEVLDRDRNFHIKYKGNSGARYALIIPKEETPLKDTFFRAAEGKKITVGLSSNGVMKVDIGKSHALRRTHRP